MECRNCKNINFYKKRVNMHIGLYCKKCHKWLKWVTHDNDCENCKFYHQWCVFSLKKHHTHEIDAQCDTYKFREGS